MAKQGGLVLTMMVKESFDEMHFKETINEVTGDGKATLEYSETFDRCYRNHSAIGFIIKKF